MISLGLHVSVKTKTRDRLSTLAKKADMSFDGLVAKILDDYVKSEVRIKRENDKFFGKKEGKKKKVAEKVAE